MKFEVKRFKELNTSELYEILKSRYEVFTVGQECLYQDCDDLDKDSYHIYLKEGGRILAYLRVVDKGVAYEEISIGRVMVLDSHRNKGLGRELMEFTISFIEDELKEERIKISAQEYLIEFYESLGFKKYGDSYLEVEIPHVKMVYNSYPICK